MGMTNPPHQTDPKTMLEQFKQELQEITEKMKSNTDKTTRQLNESACDAIKAQIAKLESQIFLKEEKPLLDINEKKTAVTNGHNAHEAKIADISTVIKKSDDKIAALKQINESNAIFSEVPPIEVFPREKTESHTTDEPNNKSKSFPGSNSINDNDLGKKNASIKENELAIQENHRILNELSQNENQEITDLDIPIVPIKSKTRLKESAPLPTITAPPIHPKSQNVKSDPHNNRSTDPSEIIEEKIPEKLKEKPIEKASHPKPSASDELRAMIYDENTDLNPIKDAKNDLDSNNMKLNLADRLKEDNNTPYKSDNTLSENIQTQLIESKNNPAGINAHNSSQVNESHHEVKSVEVKAVNESKFVQTVEKILKDHRYRIFRFQPMHEQIKTILQHFNFIAVQTRMNLPFYKDLFLDVVFVKIVDVDVDLIFDKNVDAIHFDTFNRDVNNGDVGNNISIPNAKLLIVDPLAAYLSMIDALQYTPNMPTNSDNLFLPFAKLLNIEYIAGNWHYKQKYVHFNCKFLTILKQNVHFIHNHSSVEIKTFPGFSKIQAYYLSMGELPRFLDYTYEKYTALFEYNRNIVAAQLPVSEKLQLLKYKMVFNAIVGILLIGTSIVVACTTEPLIYWILLIMNLIMISGFLGAIKFWNFKHQLKMHGTCTHYSWASLTASEINGLIAKIPSESFQRLMRSEIESASQEKTVGFTKKIHKIRESAQKLPKYGTKKIEISSLSSDSSPNPPISTLPQVQSLNKTKLIEDFLSE